MTQPSAGYFPARRDDRNNVRIRQIVGEVLGVPLTREFADRIDGMFFRRPSTT
jgi:hypothetical protein